VLKFRNTFRIWWGVEFTDFLFVNFVLASRCALTPIPKYLQHQPVIKDRQSTANVYPTRCNVTQFILSGSCSTCFGWHQHPPSGAQTTVSTASGTCHTVTATCSYRGRVGTGLSVLWVAVSGRQPQTYIKPDAADTVFELLMMSDVSLETCWKIKNVGIINSNIWSHLVGYL